MSTYSPLASGKAPPPVSATPDLMPNVTISELLTYGELTQLSYDNFVYQAQLQTVNGTPATPGATRPPVGNNWRWDTTQQLADYALKGSKTGALDKVRGGHVIPLYSRAGWRELTSLAEGLVGMLAEGSKEENDARRDAAASAHQGFILLPPRNGGGQEIIISWRGTGRNSEWLTDANAKPAPYPGEKNSGIKVHSGFWSMFTDEPSADKTMQLAKTGFASRTALAQRLAQGENGDVDDVVRVGEGKKEFEEMMSAKYGPPEAEFELQELAVSSPRNVILAVIDRLKSRNVPISRVTTSGHSLGGALAAASAFHIARYLQTEQVPVMAYTFASPRVGNAAFSQAVDKQPNLLVVRAVNRNDLVPKMPPTNVPFLEGLFKYLDSLLGLFVNQPQPDPTQTPGEFDNLNQRSKASKFNAEKAQPAVRGILSFFQVGDAADGSKFPSVISKPVNKVTPQDIANMTKNERLSHAVVTAVGPYTDDIARLVNRLEPQRTLEKVGDGSFKEVKKPWWKILYRVAPDVYIHAGVKLEVNSWQHADIWTPVLLRSFPLGGRDKVEGDHPLPVAHGWTDEGGLADQVAAAAGTLEGTYAKWLGQQLDNEKRIRRLSRENAPGGSPAIPSGDVSVSPGSTPQGGMGFVTEQLGDLVGALHNHEMYLHMLAKEYGTPAMERDLILMNKSANVVNDAGQTAAEKVPAGWWNPEIGFKGVLPNAQGRVWDGAPLAAVVFEDGKWARGRNV